MTLMTEHPLDTHAPHATDTEVLMAGFGGQGMLLAGKVLAQASMEIGKEVSWLSSKARAGSSS
jgi:Pyruvate/2-oxoacid:ferredoxin oxidoreductase gamma subunit